MAEDEGAAPAGVLEAESGHANEGAAGTPGIVRERDGHAPESGEANRAVEHRLERIEKSQTAVLERVNHLVEQFQTHAHQAVEVRGLPAQPAAPTQEPEGEGQPDPAKSTEPAPTPQATPPPPAPKVARGIGPLQRRRAKGG